MEPFHAFRSPLELRHCSPWPDGPGTLPPSSVFLPLPLPAAPLLSTVLPSRQRIPYTRSSSLELCCPLPSSRASSTHPMDARPRALGSRPRPRDQPQPRDRRSPPSPPSPRLSQPRYIYFYLMSICSSTQVVSCAEAWILLVSPWTQPQWSVNTCWGASRVGGRSQVTGGTWTATGTGRESETAP